MKKILSRRLRWFQEKSEEMGLDWFPIQWEVVPEEVLLEVMTYGLPTRARHWHYGQSYEYQKASGEMGTSKVYELILNNDPSYAFLLDTNPDIANTMVIAHCIHSNSEILTSKGPSKISEVKSGDYVFTHTGQKQRVVWCKETKKSKKMIELKCKSNNDFLVFTPDHKLLVKNDIGISWVKAKDIKEKDRIVYPKYNNSNLEAISELYIPIQTVKSSRKWKKAIEKKQGGYNIHLNHSFGRMIGLYIAEGYKNQSTSHFCFHIAEKDYHNAVKAAALEIDENIKVGFSRRVRDNSCIVVLKEKNIAKWLEDNCGKGSENKQIPSFIFDYKVPDQFLAGLIRGMYEGDGYFAEENRSSTYTTTSKTLSYQLRLLLSYFDIFSYVKDRKRKSYDIKGERKRTYEVFTNGIDHRNLLNNILKQNAVEPNRTWTFTNRDEKNFYGQIEYIRFIETEEEQSFWDMEVQNDHSFMFSSGTIAHNCIGHSHFFKQNYLFSGTDRKMVYHAAERAQRVDNYIETYGIERVEYIMDIGFALEKHLDWHKGLYRRRYSKRKKSLKKRKTDEFEDLLGNPSAPAYQTVIENRSFPPHPEKDLLWFVCNYAKLEPWEKDILEIIREESFYFYPQYLTKIMNEGFASYIHAELMYELPESELTHAEYLEFVKIHERVVQPGRSKLNINPYFLGFTILNDIKKRWDALKEEGKSEITGFEKILEVVREEDDISFLRNYLTQDICNDLGLFAYTKKYDKKREEYIQVESKKVDDIVEHMISGLFNYRSPDIRIVHASHMGLELEHYSTNVGALDPKHTRQVMKYLYNVWNGTIDLKTANRKGEVFHYTYDEEGFSHHEEDDPIIVSK